MDAAALSKNGGELAPRFQDQRRVAKHPEPAAREVFLSFDEMSLKERWVYDKVHNNVPMNNLR